MLIMLPPIDIQQLQVIKSGKLICQLERLTVEPGERLCVAGANGSGKTTLLRVLAGIERDFQGSCRVEVAASQRTYVHQMPYLFRGTVHDNVGYGLLGRGLTRHDYRSAVSHWLQRLGLSDLAQDNIVGLSGGERRRVAIARALALEPTLLLLDEPFAEMDNEGVATISRILQQLSSQTIVIMTNPNPIESMELTKSITLKKTSAMCKMSSTAYE